jgi:hypothetical protein
LNFDGYKMYFIVPPNLYLEPSNVIIFELIWMSSQTTAEDYIMAWGAFPLVNGDFQINRGKFKVPLMNGRVDYTANKFKDIEKKYCRNVDEWLANLYIEVRTFQMVGFQMHNERIELKIPKEVQDKVGVKKRHREKQMESMAKSQDAFNKKEEVNSTDDNSTTLENIKSI